MKIKSLKQKLTGLAMIALAFVAKSFTKDCDILFAELMMCYGGMFLILTKQRLYKHDYTLVFDINEFRGLR